MVAGEGGEGLGETSGGKDKTSERGDKETKLVKGK